jgi:predicted RNA-binding protein with PUA-like domain
MPELDDMLLLQKGSRLSIMPVTCRQWCIIEDRLHRRESE